MDNGRIIGVQEDHSSGYLLGDIYPWKPGDGIVGLMKKIEEGGPVAVLVDDVEIFLVLAYTYEGYELRVVSYFDWGHYLSFELFLGVGHVVFYLFYCDLSASPFSFKYLWGVTTTNFFLEDQSSKINDILLCISFDLFYNKLSEINQIIWFWGRNLRRRFNFWFLVLRFVHFLLFLLNWRDLLLWSLSRIANKKVLHWFFRFLFGFFFFFWHYWGFILVLFERNKIGQVGLWFSFLLFDFFNFYFIFFLWLIIITEKVDELYFVDVRFSLWMKNFFWCIGVSNRFLFRLIFPCIFFFFKFFFDNAEKIIKLIIFLFCNYCVYWEKIFV